MPSLAKNAVIAPKATITITEANEKRFIDVPHAGLGSGSRRTVPSHRTLTAPHREMVWPDGNGLGTDPVNRAAARLGGSHGGRDGINAFDTGDTILVRVAGPVENHAICPRARPDCRVAGGLDEAKARARSCGDPTPRFSVNGNCVAVATSGSIPPIVTVVAQGAPVTRGGCAKPRKRCANERTVRFALPTQLFL
jgi:hypothetical protein